MVGGEQIALVDQPAGVAWPTAQWPRGAPAGDVDLDGLDRLVEVLMGGTDELGHTDALVIVQAGRLVVERYGAASGPDSLLLSWSMAKSVTHAAAGLCVKDGRLDPHSEAPVQAWRDDGRAQITTEHLLRMLDGLRFEEEYGRDDADAVRMLFGDGATDVAAYAISRPLDHTPGTHFNYSSGTSNVLARIVGDIVGPAPDAVRDWLATELFAPIGAHSFEPGFDAAGTFVGSTFVHATATDFARFGQLYLRGGTWDGVEILPRAWVDHARTPSTAEVPTGEVFRYGAHWWIWDDRFGTFAAHGFGGQRIAVVPALDLVLVRIGGTPTTTYAHLRAWLTDVVACFADTASEVAARVASVTSDES